MRVLWLGLLVAGVLSACGSGEESRGGDGEGEVARGRDLYLRNGCAVCHGGEGRGDGRIARTLNPPPRDFRDLEAYRKGHAVEQIARTIKEGTGPGTPMPPYPHISAENRRLIAVFIKYLQQQE